ncbi:hypothetical protein RJG79_05080 [Mycoplasmatota bacterium WC44]
MDKNKEKNSNVEFSNEIGSDLYKSSALRGKITRNLVKIAEQQLAAETGNDPTPVEDIKNK